MKQENRLGSFTNSSEFSPVSFKIQMLIDTSRFEEAEAMIRGELAKDLEDPDLFLMLARVLCEQRKFRGAREAVKEAVALEPNDPLAFFTEAMICREQGRTKEGLKAIDRAIAIDAEDADYYSLKAGLLMDNSQWQKSLDTAGLGLALDGDHEGCLFYRGLALAKLGRGGEAEDDSLHLLELDADDASNHASRGFVLLEAGRAADATRHFSEALRIDSRREDARHGLCEAVVLSRPIAGRVMALIAKLDRINVWVILIGVILIGRVGKYFDKDPQLFWVGNTIDAAFWALALLMLTAPLLFEWVLKTDNLTRHALSDRHFKGLKMATPFLILGVLLFLIWVWGGTKSLPILAFLVLSVGTLVREMFESENRWVRIRMRWIAGAAAIAAIAILYAQFFVIGPVARELLLEVAGVAQGDVLDQKSDLMLRLKEILSLRKWSVLYPTLALLALAFFRNSITSWLNQRAPDEGWES